MTKKHQIKIILKLIQIQSTQRNEAQKCLFFLHIFCKLYILHIFAVADKSWPNKTSWFTNHKTRYLLDQIIQLQKQILVHLCFLFMMPAVNHLSCLISVNFNHLIICLLNGILAISGHRIVLGFHRIEKKTSIVEGNCCDKNIHIENEHGFDVYNTNFPPTHHNQMFKTEYIYLRPSVSQKGFTEYFFSNNLPFYKCGTVDLI